MRKPKACARFGAMEPSPGDRILARAFDEMRERRAVTGVVEGATFKVVWVCKENEWRVARKEGREPDAVPWPAEDIEPVS